jgi:hypothetical protein
VGQSSQILAGPFYSPLAVAPNEHWDIGINVNASKSATWWWVNHLMPIDPPEEVRNEETTKQETPDEILSHEER